MRSYAARFPSQMKRWLASLRTTRMEGLPASLPTFIATVSQNTVPSLLYGLSLFVLQNVLFLHAPKLEISTN